MHLSASENTYVDDDAFTIVVDSASDLIPALRSLARLVTSAFRAHGLCLNYKANKTEAMVAFRGAGAKLAYHSLVVDGGSVLQFEMDSLHIGSPPQKLSVVAAYRHGSPARWV